MILIDELTAKGAFEHPPRTAGSVVPTERCVTSSPITHRDALELLRGVKACDEVAMSIEPARR